MAPSWMRGPLFEEATNEAIRAPLPEVVIRGFELVTHLGDGATIVGIAILLYWFGSLERRRDRVMVLGIGILTLAIVAGIKGVIAAPRPQAAFSPDAYRGFSFPSAHAMGATAIYSALAVFSQIGTRRIRYAVAGTLIVLVGLSRVVIGVHFLGDVIVGTVLGIALVALVVRYGQDPEQLFVAAGAVAIVALVLGSTEFTTMTVGAAIAATVIWPVVDHSEARPLGASVLVLGVLVLPILYIFRGLTGVFTLHWGLEVVGYGFALGTALLVPVVAERLNEWTVVQTLQRRLPFRGRQFDPEAAGKDV